MRAEAGAVFVYDVSLMQPSQLCNAESALKESQPQMYVVTASVDNALLSVAGRTNALQPFWQQPKAPTHDLGSSHRQSGAACRDRNRRIRNPRHLRSLLSLILRRRQRAPLQNDRIRGGGRGSSTPVLSRKVCAEISRPVHVSVIFARMLDKASRCIQSGRETQAVAVGVAPQGMRALSSGPPAGGNLSPSPVRADRPPH